VNGVRKAPAGGVEPPGRGFGIRAAAAARRFAEMAWQLKEPPVPEFRWAAP